MYEAEDILDEKLLNRISKKIFYHRLTSLARHLGISDAEISRIVIPWKTPEEQCFQVCFVDLIKRMANSWGWVAKCRILCENDIICEIT